MASAEDGALRLIDSDVHNYPNSMDDLKVLMSKRWQGYVEQSDMNLPGASMYRKIFAQAARRDAFPPSGLRPGGDPEFVREHLLDTWQIDRAILNPLVGLSSVYNPDLGNELMRAVNEWTASVWLDSDQRWFGSILVNPHDPAASALEIARAAEDPRFVQVLLLVLPCRPGESADLDPVD